MGLLKILPEKLLKGNQKKSEQLIPQNVLRFSRRVSRQGNNRKQWKEVNAETYKGTDWLMKQHWKAFFTKGKGKNVSHNIELYLYSLNCTYSCWMWNVSIWALRCCVSESQSLPWQHTALQAKGSSTRGACAGSREEKVKYHRVLLCRGGWQERGWVRHCRVLDRLGGRLQSPQRLQR